MWLVPLNRVSQPELQLYCFPYGGAGPTIFKKWPTAIGPEIELIGVQMPGREKRIKEPGFTGMRPLINSLVNIWRERPAMPFAFLGHSLGSLISYELTLELIRQNLPTPEALIISGSKAPHLNRHKDLIHQLPDAEFIEAIRQLGGTPEAVLENEILMEVFLPVLRADFTLYENYRYQTTAPIDLPIFACGGLADKEVSPDEIKAWEKHTTSDFHCKIFPGDHFYLEENYRGIIDYFSPLLLPQHNS